MNIGMGEEAWVIKYQKSRIIRFIRTGTSLEDAGGLLGVLSLIYILWSVLCSRLILNVSWKVARIRARKAVTAARWATTELHPKNVIDPISSAILLTQFYSERAQNNFKLYTKFGKIQYCIRKENIFISLSILHVWQCACWDSCYLDL